MLLCFFGLSLLISQAYATNNQTVSEIPESYVNTTDNSLWRTLLTDCKNPTSQCVEKNMYKYLKQVLEYPKDYNLTNFLKFAKNSVNFTQIEKDHEGSDEGFDEIGFEGRSALEEMSKTFHDRGIQFLMTHDLEVQMPQTFFEGATLRIAPRSFDGNGALVKVEFVPKKIPEEPVEGRIFFKKIKKKIGQKLLYALLAILAVIKLLAVKFLFFLPMLMGVAAAKKLLIKILFFVFPAIKHLFKLCPYVPHGTKYHHHKHQIAHIHHIGGHHYPHHHHDDGIEVIHPHSDGPPIGALGGASYHHFVDIDPPHEPSYKPHEHDLEYYSGGPGLGEDIISHRKDPNIEDNEIAGQGHGRPTKKKSSRPLTPTEIENMILKAEKEALIKSRLQLEKKRIQEENILLQEQLRQAIKIQEQLKLQKLGLLAKTGTILKNSLPTVPSPYLQTPSPPGGQIMPMTSLFNIPNPMVSKNILKYTGPQVGSKVPQRADIVKQERFSDMSKPAVSTPAQGTNLVLTDHASKMTSANAKASFDVPAKKKENVIQKAIQQAASITYDPFYSPILHKIDNILVNLGYKDEPCKERLICFMYKSPEKYSPHSNLLSNELSRDARELQKPKTTNAVVVRFYRYVQAARDGQEKNNCINLYPGCDILGSEL